MITEPSDLQVTIQVKGHDRFHLMNAIKVAIDDCAQTVRQGQLGSQQRYSAIARMHALSQLEWQLVIEKVQVEGNVIA